MTAIQIETMEAKRSTDALVAEKVMGWHDMEPPRHAAGGNGSPWRGLPSGMKRFSDLEEPPKYTTDIAAAWELVENFGSAWIKLEHAYNEINGERVDGWWCEVEPGSVRVFAPTAPLAICRAALLAAMPDAKVLA